MTTKIVCIAIETVRPFPALVPLAALTKRPSNSHYPVDGGIMVSVAENYNNNHHDTLNISD